jgi:hypothetical protein
MRTTKKEKEESGNYIFANREKKKIAKFNGKQHNYNVRHENVIARAYKKKICLMLMGKANIPEYSASYENNNKLALDKMSIKLKVVQCINNKKLIQLKWISRLKLAMESQFKQCTWAIST